MTAAANYEELKEAISRAYPGLPKQLQLIARFALDKPNELALGTVAAVADAAGVTPSSLIRFANALEFGGFSQMQQVFRGHLVARSASYRERIDPQRTGNRPRGDGMLRRFVGEAVAELGHLEENVTEVGLSGAAKLITGASRVYVLAQRRAFPVASYLAHALSEVGIKTYLLDGVGGMLGNSLAHIDRDDVLVVASFYSYSAEVVDAAAAARTRNVPVIAITDSALSPLKPSAKVCFESSVGVEKEFPSLVAPLCVAQALVAASEHALSASARGVEEQRGR